jgi:hypothetical protein
MRGSVNRRPRLDSVEFDQDELGGGEGQHKFEVPLSALKHKILPPSIMTVKSTLKKSTGENEQKEVLKKT